MWQSFSWNKNWRELKRSECCHPLKPGTHINGDTRVQLDCWPSTKPVQLIFLPWLLALWTRPGRGSSWRQLCSGPYRCWWLSPAASHSGGKWWPPGRLKHCPDGYPCPHRFWRPERKKQKGKIFNFCVLQHKIMTWTNIMHKIRPPAASQEAGDFCYSILL